jgi:hypothetical protein
MSSRFGFWASVATAAAAIGYGIPQLLQVAGLLPTPLDLVLIFAPSLLLAPCFVLAMAALDAVAPAGRSPWGRSALGFACVYAALVGTVYVIQLGVVIPAGQAGEADRVALLACCGQGQFLTAVDLLGYTLMSLSTLFAAGAVIGGGIAAWTRLALVANGLLAPFLILQLAYPWLIAIGALWLVTFPLATILLALTFRQAVITEAVAIVPSEPDRGSRAQWP